MSNQPLPPIPPPAIEYASWSNAPSRAGLIGAGVVLLVFGAGGACLGIMLPLLMLMPGVQQQQDAAYMVMVTIIYLGISAGLISLGVGACRAKRWVRPMIVALGWPIVIVGVFGLFSFLANIPEFMEMMQDSGAAGGPKLPPAVGVITAVSMILFQLVLTVGAPLAMVLYIRRPKTEEILRYYDPKRNWTDACPQPVLTWAMAMGVTGALALMGLARPTVPLPGKVLHGLPAAAIVVAIAGVLLWLAYGTYRLQMRAWWASLIFSTAGSIWWVVILLSGSMLRYWEEVSTSETQLEFMRKTSGGATSIITSLLLAAITIWYILSIRKHFIKTPPSNATGSGDIAQGDLQ